MFSPCTPLCLRHRAPLSARPSPPAAAIVGGVTDIMKQNRINPPPDRGMEMSDEEKKQSESEEGLVVVHSVIG